MSLIGDSYEVLTCGTRDFCWIVRCFGYLAKEPFRIEVGSDVLDFTPPDNVYILPQFFRSFKCMCCTNCCKRGTSLIYTASQLEEIQKMLKEGSQDSTFQEFANILLDNLEERKVKIVYSTSSVEKSFWVFSKVRKDLRCFFHKMILVEDAPLEESLWICGIHRVKPTNCAFSARVLLKKQDENNVAVLTKRQYGRNWVFGCPAKVTPFDPKELEAYDLKALQFLLKNAEDMGVETFLPEIIEWLENWLKGSMLIPTKPVLIFGEKRVEDTKVDIRKFF